MTDSNIQDILNLVIPINPLKRLLKRDQFNIQFLNTKK